MVTIKDIANKVGVSRGTVDRVLHNRGRVAPEKAKLIKETAEKMGYQPNIVGRGLAARKKHLKIGFIYLDSDAAPFHRAIYQGAKEYLKDLEPFGVEVFFFPVEEISWIPEEWPRNLENLIGNHKMDGWAVIGTQGKTLEMILKKRGEENVPIVVYNMDDDAEWKLAYVGCDYLQSGRLACGVAALMTDRCGKICIASFDYGDIPSSSVRIQGFEQEVSEKYPQMEVVAKLFSTKNEDTSDLIPKVTGFLEENHNVDVLYLVNPGDYSICRQISKIRAKHRIKIITNDLVTQEQQEMVRKGEIDVTICQEPEKQGARPLEILFQYLALGIEPDCDWDKTELSVRIGQNV